MQRVSFSVMRVLSSQGKEVDGRIQELSVIGSALELTDAKISDGGGEGRWSTKAGSFFERESMTPTLI